MANSPTQAHEISLMLRAWSDGDTQALNNLLPLVYDELHRQAHRCLRHERTGHTLQTTDLIHEAYLKLAAQAGVEWENRAHFFALSAQLMRHILVDYARAKHRAKRGGEALRLSLSKAELVATEESDVDLLALDEALTRLAAIDEQQSRVVEMRYLGGLDIEETAAALGISSATVKRDWTTAKAWLGRELRR
ncbi:MAG: polymerase, sigma-24 subunit, subfamily [Acidobacteria bacterium]|nr:polymerase, sigma-24 subunit, subfamily [Acidobacteriota bacterium]